MSHLKDILQSFKVVTDFFFYSFSQSKVDRISFPKFTIFYAAKVSQNLGRNWFRMGPKGEEAPRMSNIGRWGTYVQIPTGPKI